jgi:hypothetical protein
VFHLNPGTPEHVVENGIGESIMTS